MKMNFLAALLMLLIYNQANAASLICIPEHIDLWQTSQKHNFVGSCKEYRQKRPSSAGCYGFSVEIQPNAGVGVIDRGVIDIGKLTVMQSKYVIETKGAMTKTKFEVDRRDLTFRKSETVKIVVLGEVVGGLVDAETGLCVIDKESEKKNKI